MSDHTKKSIPSDKSSEESVKTTSETAKQDGVIAGRENQSVHQNAFDTLHQNDIDPSDPRLTTVRAGETLEQLHARLKENKFEIVDPSRAEILDTGVLDAICNDKSLPEDRRTLASQYQEMRDLSKQLGLGTEVIDETGGAELANEILSKRVASDTAGKDLGGSFTALSEHYTSGKTNAPSMVPENDRENSSETTLLADGSKGKQSEVRSAGSDNKPEMHEKKIPKDGQEEISLKELLENYKTPFTDSYEKTLRLKPGEPGKSPALEQVFSRLKNCPWADEIKIKFDQSAVNTEYDPVRSVITIHPNDPPAKQIQTFAHEGFHATHQYLARLYLTGDPNRKAHGDGGKKLKEGEVSKSEYMKIRTEGEVGSFLTEIAVFNEITKGMPDSGVGFKYKDWGREREMDLAELYRTKGRAALERFILDTHAVGAPETYREHYDSSYSAQDGYKQTFDGFRKGVQDLVKKWQTKTGHTEQQFKQWDY